MNLIYEAIEAAKYLTGHRLTQKQMRMAERREHRLHKHYSVEKDHIAVHSFHYSLLVPFCWDEYAEYTADGRLLKTTSFNKIPHKAVETRFDPPGSFSGKVVSVRNLEKPY